ncbi:S8 family serine peptidase [Micromonospora sp. SL1-18]|uniref:S8 family serine peptidase n=1 Tax=Micromonospora sp. SL1-18 TaxID=3399128 RepID=UPI003A4DEDFE
MFERHADLSGADKIEDWAKRGQLVYQRLVNTARASQAGLTRALAARGVHFEQYWIANRVLVRAGDPQTLDAALAQEGVAEIQADEPVALPRPIEEKALAEAQTAAVEWGIDNVRADRVWSELGVRGRGVVVGNIDSGVQFDHPALVNQYRGNLGGGKFDHNYNWWDPSRVCPTEAPCDNNAHGTHTMGTMVGDGGAGNEIGVAPGAQWIAAKGCEASTCSLAALLSSGQFMLAPTDLSGGNPRPELRPQVVNNSWSGTGGQDFYDRVVDAWVAAGMFPVFSNGNAGPACVTAGSPADGSKAYSVGAYDSSNAIASFSSRGPGRNGEIKPNISAPGVNVRSSVPGNTYASYNGTSMAAPHLAGTVALMWSAAPKLAGDVESIRAALDLTAIDTEDLTCGGTPDNNDVYGQGRLDALGATLRVAGNSGVSGRITDAASGAGISNAQLRVLNDDPFLTTTGPDGRYRLNLLPGSYEVEVSRFGYQPLSLSDVAVKAGKVTTVNATLEPLPTGTITGKVTLDETGLGVPGVAIHHGNIPLTTTGADGTFRVDAPIGTYEVVARHEMFHAPEPVKVTIAERNSTVANFVLRCGDECNIDSLWTDRYDGSASSSDVARAMELSPDGDAMFVTGESPGSGTGTDMATIAFDPTTGDRRWEARYDGPGSGSDAGYGIGVSPNGATIYVTGPSMGIDKKTKYATVAYDAATGKKRWEARYDGPGTGDDAALALDVSPDGAVIVVTGLSDDVWNDYATVAYDAATGHQLWVSRYDGPANLTDTALSVKFAPDGATVHITGYSRPASGVANDSDYATIAYRATTGEELWVARYSGPVTGGSDLAQDLQVSPDSSKVFVTGYSAGKNRDDAATIAYDRATGDELWVARYDGPARGIDMGFALDVSPDGSAVYVTGRSAGIGSKDDYVTIAYDAQTGNELWVARFDGPAKGDDIAQDVQVSPNGSAVFVSGHSLGVGTNADYATVGYDAATGAQLWSARYNGPGNSFDGVNALRVSPDSARVFVTGHSFGIGTSRDYATLAYNAAATPELPVFVPWGLQSQSNLVMSDGQAEVSVNVTNVGAAGGVYDAALLVDGRVQETKAVPLEPGGTSRVEWTVKLDEPGKYQIRVGHVTAPLRVVGCDKTITRTHPGALTVTEGVTCLAEGARVTGPVDVRAGAGLVATDAAVSGKVSAVDAAVVALRDSRIAGPITITGAAGLELIGNQVSGNIRLDDNTADDGFALVVAGNRIVGHVSCTGNTPPPVNQGMSNDMSGRATGQCADL